MAGAPAGTRLAPDPLSAQQLGTLGLSVSVCIYSAARRASEKLPPRTSTGAWRVSQDPTELLNTLSDSHTCYMKQLPISCAVIRVNILSLLSLSLQQNLTECFAAETWEMLLGELMSRVDLSETHCMKEGHSGMENLRVDRRLFGRINSLMAVLF